MAVSRDSVFDHPKPPIIFNSFSFSFDSYLRLIFFKFCQLSPLSLSVLGDRDEGVQMSISRMRSLQRLVRLDVPLPRRIRRERVPPGTTLLHQEAGTWVLTEISMSLSVFPRKLFFFFVKIFFYFFSCLKDESWGNGTWHDIYNLYHISSSSGIPFTWVDISYMTYIMSYHLHPFQLACS